MLNIKNLTISFYKDQGPVVDDIGFDIKEGEVLGIVGESGSGKTLTALSILGLLPKGAIPSGSIIFDGQELLNTDVHFINRLRGRDISMVFQEPGTSLNPVLSIGSQIIEPLIAHKGMSKRLAVNIAKKWLDRVKIQDAYNIMKCYPHQLSGGMCQRIMIAMSMICQPRLLIADEPLTALDVTTQAEILSLMIELKEELKTAIILITHDMGVIARCANRVVVMYAGQILEKGKVRDLFGRPLHPYTRGLIESTPVINKHCKRLKEIKGNIPTPGQTLVGCIFADRCNSFSSICLERRPKLLQVRKGQYVRCFEKI